MQNLRKFVQKSLIQAALIIFTALIIGFTANLVRTNPIAWIGDWSASSRVEANVGQDITIPIEEAMRLYKTGNVLFIDARPDLFFEVGHIKGAISLPLEQFEELFNNVMEGIDRNSPIITYCDGEQCELSHDLAAALMEKGFTNVRVLINGWTIWQENNLPIKEEAL